MEVGTKVVYVGVRSVEEKERAAQIRDAVDNAHKAGRVHREKDDGKHEHHHKEAEVVKVHEDGSCDLYVYTPHPTNQVPERVLVEGVRHGPDKAQGTWH